jgi:hypothetical protein
MPSLRVRVADPVHSRISDVAPSIVSDVLEVLTALADKPKLGTPQVAGPHEGKYAYDFRVSRLPVSRTFTLVYEVDNTEGTLDVVEFGVRRRPQHPGGPTMPLEDPTFRVG